MKARSTDSQPGELLEGLGFSPRSKPDELLGYEHAKTGTIFCFAPHAEQEPVIPHDLVRVHRMLDLVNLLSAEDFASWCSRASAVDEKAVSRVPTKPINESRPLSDLHCWTQAK